LPSADLYIDRIDFRRYLTETDCLQCGYPSCEAFIAAINAANAKPLDCSFIGTNKAYAFEATERIRTLWPEVPLLTHPRPGFTGLIELNNPGPDSLLLISGNNEYTEEVLMTVLGTTICPFFFLFVDTDGNTVDMSMIYKTLTSERVSKAIKETGIEVKVAAQEMIIPGLAAPLQEEIERLTGWNVRVGPECAAELPLFLSEIWIPVDSPNSSA
jgi:CO dehydrogenase/acetyl-CoA synthase gamma subunit (corrinoid Fe-S protein)